MIKSKTLLELKKVVKPRVALRIDHPLLSEKSADGNYAAAAASGYSQLIATTSRAKKMMGCLFGGGGARSCLDDTEETKRWMDYGEDDERVFVCWGNFLKDLQKSASV
jgi:hypothetical protein